MASVEDQFAQLRNAVAGAHAVTLAHVAALTWMAYDTCLTLRLEVNLMWRTKFSLLKFLYFAVRYYTLLALIIVLAVNTNSEVKFHPKFCDQFTWFYTLSTNFPVFLGEGIMIMRIYALYNKSRKILAFTLVLYLAHIGVSLALTSLSSMQIKVIVPPFPIPVPGCLHTALPVDNTRVSVPACSFNFIVAVVYFFLTAWKFLSNLYTAEDIRKLGIRRIISGSRSSQPVLHLFVRDGSIYFLVVLGAEIVFLYFMVRYNNQPLMIMGQSWEMATYAVSSTRLILSLSGSLTSGRKSWGRGISSDDRAGSDMPLDHRGRKREADSTLDSTAWSSEY